jgi:hypothetical protein
MLPVIALERSNPARAFGGWAGSATGDTSPFWRLLSCPGSGELELELELELLTL